MSEQDALTLGAGQFTAEFTWSDHDSAFVRRLLAAAQRDALVEVEFTGSLSDEAVRACCAAFASRERVAFRPPGSGEPIDFRVRSLDHIGDQVRVTLTEAR